MNAAALTVWVCAFASFFWGASKFFRTTRGRLTRQTAMVAACGLAFSIEHAVAIARSIAGSWPTFAGGLALALSVGLFWAAITACRTTRLTAIFENDRPQHLQRTGPYRHVRHPFYAAYTLFWFGGAIASASVCAVLSAAVMLGIYLAAIRDEERKFAASPLAEEYAEYRQAVPMLIPGTRRRGIRR